jgi:hypothetical protein
MGTVEVDGPSKIAGWFGSGPGDRSDAVNAVFTAYIDIDIILQWI